MKFFDWDNEKNTFLKKERDVSFEQVELAIASGDLLDRVRHPNPDRYPNQKVFLVRIEDYVYSVPYVEGNEKILGRQDMKKTASLNTDEIELGKSLENEEWVSDLTKKDKKQYEEYARYSLNKQKRINIRMTERDLKKIQAKAIEEGLPYQSLKYNEGKLRIN